MEERATRKYSSPTRRRSRRVSATVSMPSPLSPRRAQTTPRHPANHATAHHTTTQHTARRSAFESACLCLRWRLSCAKASLLFTRRLCIASCTSSCTSVAVGPSPHRTAPAPHAPHRPTRRLPPPPLHHTRQPSRPLAATAHVAVGLCHGSGCHALHAAHCTCRPSRTATTTSFNRPRTAWCMCAKVCVCVCVCVYV